MWTPKTCPTPRSPRCVVVVLGLLVLLLPLVGGMAVAASPAGAQAPADPDYVLGSGRAVGSLMKAGPSAGELDLAPTVGHVIVQYTNTTASADSRTLDFGLIADFVGEVNDIQPQFAEARSTDPKRQSDERRFEGTPADSPVEIGGGEQSARASDKPMAFAEFRLNRYELPGVYRMNGGVSRSSTGIIDGVRRSRAFAAMSELSLGGGVVVLSGVEMEAIAVLGPDDEKPELTALFSVSGIRSEGQPLAVTGGGNELTIALDVANKALAPSGISIEPPRATVMDGIAKVTPIGIRFGGSSERTQLSAPVLGAAGPVREPLTKAFVENFPSGAILNLLADIALGIATGASSVELNFGGVTATVEAEAYENPLALLGLGTLPSTPDRVTPGTPGVAGSAGVAAVPGAAGADAATTEDAARDAQQPVGAIATPYAPTIPYDLASSDLVPGATGAGLGVGLVALFLAAAAGFRDYQRIRRDQAAVDD